MAARLAPEAPELIWFRGSDAVRFLNDLISQEIGDLAPGSVAGSLLLGPQGKLDFILWVLRGDDEVGLVTEDGRGEELVAHLGRYRIRVDVEIEPETNPIALLVGERTIGTGTWAESGGTLRADLSWHNLERELLVGPNLGNPETLEPGLYDTLRIEAGVPLMGVDTDENTIPQETGLVEATVSFDKGCFLGQELVARLDSRGGRVNRHLRKLEFDSAVPVGTRLRWKDREVGTVTTAAGNLGLALVWREVGPGDRIEANGSGVTVREIPQKSESAFTGS